MTSFAYRADQVRALEQAVMAVEGPNVLMQRAAHGLARSALDLLRQIRGSVYGARVVILAGTGNNAGDALYAGARLARRGVRVTAVLCLGRTHEAGLAALLAAGGVLRSAEEAGLVNLGAVPRPPIDLFVDGILGIGGRAGLTAPLTDFVAVTGRWSIPLLAVDLPSGVDTDTGAVPGPAIQATRTVTFGVLKPCHLVEPARSRCGEIELVDIGLDDADPNELPVLQGLSDDVLAQAWPYPPADGDKYARGVVGIDTGSDTYPGAAVLSTYGAVYAGAGMVRFLGSERPAQIIGAQLPSVVFSPGRVQANLFGSGWGDRADGRDVLLRAAEEGLPAVVDADGLRYLPDRCPEEWLLTPHAGELARLLDVPRSKVEADPLRAVRAGAEQTGATVLLKGATQLVARPDRDTVFVARPGPAWTAQAGSGDVLAGVCAALLAAVHRPQYAGQLGASIQAAAAEAHPGAVPPQELARAIGSLLGDLQRRRDELVRRRW
ncbi:NAD(P)H-hydrate epimerase [uncultured Friedmanniella sp.]|uniref:NAD(P)H-hydrate epimerase n=1 Tax=uncultured Friedmanniella sp. TaxID=335381 RepID=UPI0035CC8184